MKPINRAEHRIIAALERRPMTVNEIAATAHVTTPHLYHLVKRLKEAGRIRKGEYAPRVHGKGATPRYWEKAA
jgi:DNA-binding MarR family transcriptional regulator